MGIRRVTSNSPCQILVTRVARSLLKSASGAKKFISSILQLRKRRDIGSEEGSTRLQNLTMGMKFASKFNGTLMVKSQLFKLVKGVLGQIDNQDKACCCFDNQRTSLLKKEAYLSQREQARGSSLQDNEKEGLCALTASGCMHVMKQENKKENVMTRVC
eukprot:152119-Pelagomonas_calceolata.AAC.1